jgi:hypothetical protein
MKKLVYLFAICVFPFSVIAQENDVSVLQTILVDGDTIPIVFFPEFSIQADRTPEKRTFASQKEEKKYGKLKDDVIKVYPYALMAGDLLNQYAKDLSGIKSKKQKRAFTKKLEEEIDSDFGYELGHMSVNQQVILIKLIDRQTGDTSYEILQEFRGYVSAFFWQGLARVFGHNLKSDYDGNGDEEMIEEIIAEIEREKIDVSYSELLK